MHLCNSPIYHPAPRRDHQLLIHVSHLRRTGNVASRLCCGRVIINGLGLFCLSLDSIVSYRLRTTLQGSSPKQAQQSTLVRGFVNLLAQRFHRYRAISFCTHSLRLSRRCLALAIGGVAKRDISTLICTLLCTRTYLLLSDSRLSINRVTLQLGFSSRSTFHGFFGDHSKLSPLSCHGARS